MNYKIRISDGFWNRYRDLVKAEMIPYQWAVLNDAIPVNIEKERDDASIPNEKSHAIENFKIAAGRTEGEHYGWVFQDSDVYKWLEAAAYTLSYAWDDKLKKTVDEVIDLIAEAQEEDGYLNTYFTIMEPERKYKRLGESHELYCAGHFIEAAVACHEITGNEKALLTAKKLADHICKTFGKGSGQIHGVDGHEEIETGLMRLYHLTGEKTYLNTADFFLRERGKDPHFFDKQAGSDQGKPVIDGIHKFPMKYYQMHLPVELQDSAEGHAVRLVYMCTALADLAKTTHDAKLAETCRKIWKNITEKRMYITGGIGSTVIGEAFTLDYDLPNDTMYCETCASIGLIFFARQMLSLESKAEYADVMERALYNTVLSGMALDGKHFFYVNPLEVVPKKSELDPGKSHVKPVRPQWLGCACCPPNLARLLSSLDRYIYTVKEDEILLNLFIRSKMECTYHGHTVKITQSCDYPKSGEMTFTVENTGTDELCLKLRIPGWADGFACSVNGCEAPTDTVNGYLALKIGAGEHRVELHLALEVKRWYASPKVSEDIGKVAIARGPFVYCAESVDNGVGLHGLILPKGAAADYEWRADLLEGVGVISLPGFKITADDEGPLYDSVNRCKKSEQRIKMIPYYAWANRGENEMRVWLHESTGEENT
ncbi:MAG: glycoside hydrolase family 127 protein [Lachnospiraceae bacterium]|nr:glycoside hydrolase family 127 protein [Lachnospiraceae bacterium]